LGRERKTHKKRHIENPVRRNRKTTPLFSLGVDGFGNAKTFTWF